MNLTLQREPRGLTGTLGELVIETGPFCHTLEPLPDAKYPDIPAGKYRVALTVSDRAQKGELWTPDERFRLPQLMDVPGRTGIRIHALNTANETLGCIGVGVWYGGEFLTKSRDTLRNLIDRLDIEEIAQRESYIEILEAA